jgi:hypothetical protein
VQAAVAWLVAQSVASKGVSVSCQVAHGVAWGQAAPVVSGAVAMLEAWGAASRAAVVPHATVACAAVGV